MRSHPQPWRDTVKRIKLQFKRHKCVDEITYVIIGDRIAKHTLAEVDLINSYNKYIVHHSSGKKVYIRVKVITAYRYFREIHAKYGIVWNQDADLARQLDTISDYRMADACFPILDDNGQQKISDRGRPMFWTEDQLLPL